MGALIAIAAGGLFVSACKKEEKGAAAKDPEPAKTEPVKAEPEKKPEATAPKPEEAAPPAEGEKVSKVDCMGVNACKGQGTCKTDKHGCGGQNACKGQGVLEMTEAECSEKGGTVFAKK
jgi:hypothetical protein